MKTIKNKNKLSKKIMISSLALSSLVGISGYIYNINQTNNLEDTSKIETKEEKFADIGTKAVPTAITLKPLPGTGPGAMAYLPYPFEIDWTEDTSLPVNNPKRYGNFFDFFDLTGGVAWSNIRSISFGQHTIQDAINNLPNAAIFSIPVQVRPHVSPEGELLNTAGDVRPFGAGLKSGPAITTVTPKEGVTDKGIYASDEVGKDPTTGRFVAEKYLLVSNPISTGSTDIAVKEKFDTHFEVTNVIADNISGDLRIEYNIQNTFTTQETINGNGGYNNKVESGVRIISDEFRTTRGPTRIDAITSTTSLIKPSSVPTGDWLDQAQMNNYFTLANVLNTDSLVNPVQSTFLERVKVTSHDDEKGTINVTAVVTGGYFDSNSVPVRDDGEEHEINLVVSGFLSAVEEVDNTLLFVGLGVGGGVFAIIIVVIIAIIMNIQKKKNIEAKKRKSMEDRLNMAGPGGQKSVAKGPGVGMAPGAMAPGAMAPGATPGGPSKYVPPTISVPKSNAPQAKRPSGPLPIKK